MSGFSGGLPAISEDEGDERADIGEGADMVPRQPLGEIAGPQGGAFRARWRDGGERIVERDVERHGDDDDAGKESRLPMSSHADPGFRPAQDAGDAEAKQSSAVPKKARPNVALRIVTLIEFMAAMPCSGGSFASAVMMKLEKAKNKPAIRPLPCVAMRVRSGMRAIIARPPICRSRRFPGYTR